MVLKPLGVSVSETARNFGKAEYMLQKLSISRGKGTGAEVEENRKKISSFNNLILACLNMLRYHSDKSPGKANKIIVLN